MNIYPVILFFIAFGIIAVASNQIAKLFQKIKLPHITGLLFIGIISGPFVLDLVGKESIANLNFVNQFSLAFIAFAAGSELYLKELRSRYKSITWMTFGQLIVTFVLSSLLIYYIGKFIPFIGQLSASERLVISLLSAVVFVARSPASAIAIINEMRAKGPFTQTVMGVTVVKDVLVIVLFAIIFSFSKSITNDVAFDFNYILILIAGIVFSILLGYFLGKILSFIVSFKTQHWLKTVFVLLVGFSAFIVSDFLQHIADEKLHFQFHLEPLLITIIAGFYVTNYTNYRLDFQRVIEAASLPVYVAFFTLTGASISLDVLVNNWYIALFFFGIRIITMIIGSYIGGKLGGDPPKLFKYGWMPYITQAGVALGLVSIISKEFSGWGNELATLLITVIVLNQIVGPPLFKWVLDFVGESHKKGHEIIESNRDVVIFGLESQSIALANRLKEHHWHVRILTRREDIDKFSVGGINICYIKQFDLQELQRLQVNKADVIVTMNTDEENLQIMDIAYEHFGTKDLVVRLNDRLNTEKFRELGALIVEPSTAIVGLMDHFVRSPIATSLLLGLDSNQDTIDIEIQDENIHGMALRDLRLPLDVLVLSIKRGDSMVISHGYTRLRVGDILTVVGTNESLEELQLKFTSFDAKES